MKPIGPKLMPYNGGVPRHWNCRSNELPITATYRELGLDIDEIGLGQRVSAGGLVDADVDYEEWLRGQPESVQNRVLGKGIADLWRTGEIDFAELIDRATGQPLTLQDFQRLKLVESEKGRAREGVVRSVEEFFSAFDDVYNERMWRADRPGADPMDAADLTRAQEEMREALDAYHRFLNEFGTPEEQLEFVKNLQVRAAVQRRTAEREWTRLSNLTLAEIDAQYTQNAWVTAVEEASMKRLAMDRRIAFFQREIDWYEQVPSTGEDFEEAWQLMDALERNEFASRETQRALRDAQGALADAEFEFYGIEDQMQTLRQRPGAPPILSEDEPWVKLQDEWTEVGERMQRLADEVGTLERAVQAENIAGLVEFTTGTADDFGALRVIENATEAQKSVVNRAYQAIRDVIGANPYWSDTYDGDRLPGTNTPWYMDVVGRAVDYFTSAGKASHLGRGGGLHRVDASNAGDRPQIEDFFTMIHEFGHALETTSDTVARYVSEFLRYRAGVNYGSPNPPKPNWRSDQHWYPGFTEDYAGVVYQKLEDGSYAATEWLASSIAMFMRQPYWLAEHDYETFKVIFEILSGRIPRPGYWDSGGFDS